MIDKRSGFQCVVFLAALATIATFALVVIDRLSPSNANMKDVMVDTSPRHDIFQNPEAAKSFSPQDRNEPILNRHKTSNYLTKYPLIPGIVGASTRQQSNQNTSITQEYTKNDLGDDRQIRDSTASTNCPQANNSYNAWLDAKRLCALNDENACRDIPTRRIDFETLNGNC